VEACEKRLKTRASCRVEQGEMEAEENGFRMGWREALKWMRVKMENYTMDDALYFLDEELKE